MSETWLDKIHNGRRGIIRRTEYLKILSDAAKMLGMDDLADQLYDVADGIMACADTMNEAVGQHIGAELAQSQRALGETFAAVLEKIADDAKQA
jgi:hypothetical protein